MKRHFVLDDNIIRFAQALKNKYGEDDSTCLDLLERIERNCHALVMGPTFWGRYWHHVNVAQREQRSEAPRVSIHLVPLLYSMAKNNRWVSDIESKDVEGLDQLPGIDEEDRDFVIAAASVPSSILVTDDDPLKTSLESNQIDQQHGFRVRTPQEALDLAGPDNP